MEWVYRVFRAHLSRVLESDHISVLVITISVQGLVMASQLLIVPIVEPAVLGRIRLLESAFAVALLATSCGIPSLAFRRAAILDRTEMRAQLLAAITLTTIASLIVGVVSFWAIAFQLWTFDGLSLPLLMCMVMVLVPANVSRVAVAVVQGARLSKLYALRLLFFSTVSVLLLAVGTALGGPLGWVALRFGVECALCWLLWRAIVSKPKYPTNHQISTAGRLGELLRAGIGANYAFLARVCADNLPLLMLSVIVGPGVQIGWLGLANLLLFAPMLVLSTATQSRLPSLIQAISDKPAFDTRLISLLRSSVYAGAGWGVAMLVLAGILYSGWVIPAYAGAAKPLAILALGLPARAMVLTAGAAGVAHGWFAFSSLITLAEIAVIVMAFMFGVSDAEQMTFAVTVSVWVAVAPALLILAKARSACR